MGELSQAASLRGHRGGVNCLAGEGDTLVSGGEDGTVRLWDLGAQRTARAMVAPGAQAVNALAVGRGGCEHFVFGAAGRDVFAYDLRAPGVLMREPAVPSLGGSSDEVGALAIDAAGEHVAIGDDSGEVRVVNLDGDSQPPELDAAHGSICACLAFRPAGGGGGGLELLSGGTDAFAVRWDCLTGATLCSWCLAAAAPPAQSDGAAPRVINPRHVHSLAFEPGGTAFAAALGDGSIELRDANHGALLAAAPSAHGAAASQVVFAPQLGGAGWGTAVPLLSAGDDSRLRLWACEPPPAEGASEGASLRAVGSASLAQKPNWVLPHPSGVVCVAGTSDAVGVWRVSGGIRIRT